MLVSLNFLYLQDIEKKIGAVESQLILKTVELSEGNFTNLFNVRNFEALKSELEKKPSNEITELRDFIEIEKIGEL
jgi:hypothetical protein